MCYLECSSGCKCQFTRKSGLENNANHINLNLGFELEHQLFVIWSFWCWYGYSLKFKFYPIFLTISILGSEISFFEDSLKSIAFLSNSTSFEVWFGRGGLNCIILTRNLENRSTTVCVMRV